MKKMKLSAPKQITWWIGLILLIVGVILVVLPRLGVASPSVALGVVLIFASALLLVLATYLKGL
jgi:drug/metabolite transporter (DMT)-like permease